MAGYPYESPLGAAIMGRSKGEIVTIETGNGLEQYRIIEIRRKESRLERFARIGEWLDQFRVN